MDISGQVIAVIDALAAKLGVAAEYVYPLMIRQAYVEGVISLLRIVLVCVYLYGLYRAIKWLKEDGWNADLEFVYMLSLVFAGIAAIAFVAFVPSCIKIAVTAFANPEWYAIQQILKLVK